MLVATTDGDGEELVSARRTVLAIEAHTVASIDEAERGVHTRNDLGYLASKNRYPVHVCSIRRRRAQGINPEIDVAAVRRKDDVPIFVRCILHNRPFAVRGNVVKHQAPRTVRVTHDSRQVIAVGRNGGQLDGFAVHSLLDGIMLKGHLLLSDPKIIRSCAQRKDCNRAD